MNEFFITLFTILGMGTVGVAVRDVWEAARSRFATGRRKEDMKRLQAHYSSLETEWDELGRAQERLDKAKGKSNEP